MAFHEKVLGVRWKFCVCWSVIGKQRSRLRDRHCRVFTHQGPVAFWSDTSHGKWELQQILDLSCKGWLLHQWDLSHGHVSPEVRPAVTGLNGVEMILNMDFLFCT